MRVGAVLVGFGLLVGCTGLNPAYEGAQSGVQASVGGEGSTGDRPVPPGGGAEGTTTLDEDEDGSTESGEPDPLDDDGATTGEMGSTGESSGPDESSSGGMDGDPAHVIYLNFDGAELAPGPDDAPAGTSTTLPGVSAPFQSPGQIPAIVGMVEDAWTGLDVQFVTDEPDEGPYTMVVITPSNPLGAGVLGISDLDCANANVNSVAAAFTDSPVGPDIIATVISRELGFSHGLEIVESETDFMRSTPGPGDEFVDNCAVLGAPPAICPHVGCPDGMQNTYAELEERLGPA